MEILTIADPETGSTAKVLPELGFNCFSFVANLPDGRSVNVLDAVPDFETGTQRPSSSGIPILFPFPNRIRDGRFRWQDKEFEIGPERGYFDAFGNAMHGFCLDRPWLFFDVTENQVHGRFELHVDAPDRSDFWPANFILFVTYTVTGAELRMDVRIQNPDSVALPWGFGTHPYFRLPLGENGSPSNCLISAATGKQWELENCLPTGEIVPVPPEIDLREGTWYDTLQLDHVYTGLTHGPEGFESGILDEASGLQVRQLCDRNIREFVVYTPADRLTICLEPYTCATDAIHLEQRDISAGWRSLLPGREVAFRIRILADEVVA